jgi:peptidyl-tRNA hydrolase
MTDGGKTEFHGEPTRNAIGPDKAGNIDKITEALPLL